MVIRCDLRHVRNVVVRRVVRRGHRRRVINHVRSVIELSVSVLSVSVRSVLIVS